MRNAEARGDEIRAGLRRVVAGEGWTAEVRGRGLMIGLALERPCAAVVGLAADEGLLVNVTQERVIRLLPPLIFTAPDATLLVERLARAVRRFFAVA